MPAATRACPSCRATLPDDAAFCHKCGAATPHEIDGATGEVRFPPRSDIEEARRRARLQAVLGETCEVRRLLGRGGFAEVYVAYDRRLKREIAVKTIRGDLLVTETLLERFQREAEAVAKLRHPNVIPIYSVGESDGLAYYTMPLIEGETLAAAIEREQRLPVADACRILREAALALDAAHRAGLVHRDVKPENLMLEGPERSVVVMDFGIAKAASSTEEQKGLTGTGMLVGTPQYMSPEQALGERTLDARSDQYALAMVGYRMLAGRLPFDGAAAQTQIFQTVTEVPPPVAQVAPDVPRPVSDVIARALAKSPADRFESMAAFAAALTSAVAGSTGATVAATQRARPALRDRVATMREQMPRLRDPLVTLGVLAAIAFAVLTARTVLTPAFTTAAARDDAIFAAQTFMSTRAPERYDATARLVEADTTFRFLYRVAPFDEAQRRAARDVPVWEWQVRLQGAHARDHWDVWIGPRNRVTAFRQLVDDTTGAPTVAADSARVLAAREVRAHGWQFADLAPLRDSSVVQRRRTDYLFRWRQQAGALPWSGADSAFLQIGVWVNGDHVGRYAETLRLPNAFLDALRPNDTAMVVTVLGVLGALLAGMYLLSARQHVDRLQWASLRPPVVVATALAIVARIPRQVDAVSTAPSQARALVITIMGGLGFVCLGAGVLVAAVTGESLAQARRPAVTAGLDDVARGRLLIPEMVPAVLRGYLLAALLLAASTGVAFAALRLGLLPPSAPDLNTTLSTLPLVDRIDTPIMPAVWLGFLLLLATSLAAARRVPAWAVPVIPAVLLAAIPGGMGEPAVACETLLLVLITATACWRWGLLTAMVTISLYQVVSATVPLLLAGTARFTLAGVLMLLCAVAPAVLAVVAYRRFASDHADTRHGRAALTPAR